MGALDEARALVAADDHKDSKFARRGLIASHENSVIPRPDGLGRDPEARRGASAASMSCASSRDA